jgi:hypothetical protein
MDPGPISFTLLHCFTLLALFTFTCILLSFYHLIRSILFLQQTGEIDNLDVGRMTTQLGTPRGRYDEHSSKFSLRKKLRFIIPVGKSQT